MREFFTVDRAKTLCTNQLVTMASIEDIAPEFYDTLTQLYPEGISLHGERYLLNGHYVMGNHFWEHLWELVRRAEFREKPSRFQSMFAVESLQEAQEYRGRYGREGDPIWRIRGVSRFRGDMELITNAPHSSSALKLIRQAHVYWSGSSSGNDSIWEHLVDLPVKIVELVDGHLDAPGDPFTTQITVP